MTTTHSLRALVLVLIIALGAVGCGDENELPDEDRELITSLYTSSIAQPNPRVKVETVRLMLLTGDAELTQVSQSLRLSDDPHLRAWGLVHWAVDHPKEGMETALVAAKSADAPVATAVATGLAGHLEDPAQVSQLVEAMGVHEDPAVSVEATRILLSRNKLAVVSPDVAKTVAEKSTHPILLGALMRSGPEEARSDVAAEVFRRAGKKSKAQKGPLMAMGYGANANQEEKVQKAAKKAAKLFGEFAAVAANGAGNESLDAARKNLASPEKELVVYTLDMLGRVNTEDSYRLVSAAKRDTKASVRVAAIRAMSKHDVSDYKDYRASLKDSDPLVVTAAMEAVFDGHAKFASLLVTDLLKVPARRKATLQAMIETHDRALLYGKQGRVDTLAEIVDGFSDRLTEMALGEDPDLRVLAAEVLSFQSKPSNACKVEKASAEITYACFTEMAVRPPPEGRTHEEFIRERLERAEKIPSQLAMGTALWAAYRQARIHAQSTESREEK